MEDIKNTQKLNNVPVDPPEVKRLEDGSIDLEAITIDQDEKGNRIVPDEILNSYYRELPSGIVNKSKTWRTSGTGGKLKILGGDPENDIEIQRAGANVLNATLSQRKSFSEAVDVLLRKKASKQAIEELDLPENANNLDVVMAAAIKQVQQGNIKAMEYLRDTAGEKPTEKIDASLSAMTPEQQRILEDIKAFNSNT